MSNNCPANLNCVLVPFFEQAIQDQRRVIEKRTEVYDQVIDLGSNKSEYGRYLERAELRLGKMLSFIELETLRCQGIRCALADAACNSILKNELGEY